MSKTENNMRKYYIAKIKYVFIIVLYKNLQFMYSIIKVFKLILT